VRRGRAERAIDASEPVRGQGPSSKGARVALIIRRERPGFQADTPRFQQLTPLSAFDNLDNRHWERNQ